MDNPQIAAQKSEISSAIKQAAADFAWEAVRDLVSEGLDQQEWSLTDEYDLRQSRVEANFYLADRLAQLDDLNKMLELAATAADDIRTVKALNERTRTQILLVRKELAREDAEKAIAIAQRLNNQQLEARSLNLLGWVASANNNYLGAESYYMQALSRSSNGISYFDEAWALGSMTHLPQIRNKPQRVEEYLERGLSAARISGSPLMVLFRLNDIAIASQDLARRRRYYRQALNIATTINFRDMLAILHINLAWFHWRLGLYSRALEHARESVHISKKYGMFENLAYSLHTRGRIAQSLGEFDLAQTSYSLLADLAHELDNITGIADFNEGLGRLALDQDQLEESISYFEKAVTAFHKAGLKVNEASTLACLAAVYLGQDEQATAMTLSEKALAKIEHIGSSGFDNPYQEIWWWRYRVLAAENDQFNGRDAWQALDAARLAMFEPIANIGDEGLRRNYLNKPQINRAISESWVKEAVQRNIPLTPFTERKTTPVAVAEQLQRIVESGARLAVERDSDKLADFIIQEFVDLSGVERAIMGIRVGAHRDSPLQWAAIVGFSAEENQAVSAFVKPYFEQAAATRAPILVDSAGDIRPEDIPELHLRSLIALPLISHGRLWGVLYGDLRHLFGRLNENDRDILSLLANQGSAALENANWVRTLEQQVADRTAEAEAARTEAELANKAKSTFMSNMSHELRTPLNAIIGFTRIVKRKAKGVLPEKQIDNLGKVLSSAEHLLGLINTILDIAKIEAGRMDIINSRFTIGPLIEMCLATTQPLLMPGVALLHKLEADLPEVYSDQDKIKQILLNLLSNAAKFTHEGIITVSTYQENNRLNIDVTDTGIGMNEEALGRIFEEFQQAEATTSQQYGGTGLGMSISKHLAGLLGGDLTATSIIGQGSTFTLEIPFESTNP